VSRGGQDIVIMNNNSSRDPSELDMLIS